MNTNKMEYNCFNWVGAISTLNGSQLKLVDKIIYLGSSISSTERDVNMCLAKGWTDISRLLNIWISDLSDEIKWDFFPSGSCVNTTVQMHHMNADKMYWEKDWQKLHKNAMSYIEQILEATPHEKISVRPLTSHL